MKEIRLPEELQSKVWSIRYNIYNRVVESQKINQAILVDNDETIEFKTQEELIEKLSK